MRTLLGAKQIAFGRPLKVGSKGLRSLCFVAEIDVTIADIIFYYTTKLVQWANS